MDLPYHFRLGIIGHFYSPLPVTLTLSPSGNPGGIFVTDVTGDGTGDGSFASNGSAGDVLREPMLVLSATMSAPAISTPSSTATTTLMPANPLLPADPH